MSDLLKFPCEFTLKVVGAAAANIEEIAIPVLQQNNINIESMKIATKSSSGGKYTSLTLTIEVDSQQQLDKIYSQLSSHPQIALVL